MKIDSLTAALWPNLKFSNMISDEAYSNNMYICKEIQWSYYLENNFCFPLLYSLLLYLKEI